MVYFSGFADEAADSIDLQIKATKELGWENIECRNVDGKNITDVSDQKFEEIYNKLQKAGVKINCFGSAVANWGKDPVEEEDFKQSVEELKRAIPRMKKLGTKMIRGMSFAILKDQSPDNQELEKKILEKLKVLVGMCEEADITYVHENCMNYFSQSYEHMDRLVKAMDSPYFKIVFDTGNPPMADNRMGEKPYEKQSSWEAYQHLKDHIQYVHIKDSIFKEEIDGIFPKMKFTYPGEGDGDVRKIVKDLLINGYDGGFSMEPHMASVYHEKSEEIDEDFEDFKYKTYVEYGKRFMKLIEDIKSEIE